MVDLTSLNCLVVGGCGRVGSAICSGLLDCGARVTAVGRSAFQPGANQKSARWTYVQADVTQKESFERALDKTNNLGPITTLVNCASYRPSLINEDCSEVTNWADSVLNNSLALFIPTSLITEHFISQSIQGSVITVSSIYGLVGPNFSIYGDSGLTTEPDYSYNKAAAIGFNRYMASKYASKKITFNAIALGGMLASQPAEFIKSYENAVPMGRMASASDVSHVACFLASEHARYITGAVIPVDGGWCST